MIFATVAPTPQHLRYTSSTEPTPLFQSSAITRRNPPTSGSGKETQKSLSEITQAFLKYIRNAPNPEIIDLSDFCNEYDIVKRRIYDITCVMEGVGLLEKRNKNAIAWTGGTLGEGEETESISTEDIHKLKLDIKEEVTGMIQEGEDYDRLIEQLLQDQDYGDKLYLPFDTIRKLYNKNEMLLGIRAPRGTVLTVPDPDENMPRGIRRFEVDLTTPGVSTGLITMDMIQPERYQEFLQNQLTAQ